MPFLDCVIEEEKIREKADNEYWNGIWETCDTHLDDLPGGPNHNPAKHYPHHSLDIINFIKTIGEKHYRESQK